jgi:hypothetical protein
MLKIAAPVKDSVYADSIGFFIDTVNSDIALNVDSTVAAIPPPLHIPRRIFVRFQVLY